MKAIVQDRYGSPSHLRLAERAMPEVGPDQVLVRVHAASLNSGDWRRVRGAPFLVRADSGWLRPKLGGVGTDAAGIVEAIGSNVTHVAPGDRVYGTGLGACAEYVAGKNFVAMPANLSFEEAAAIPVAGSTALQAVRDHGQVQAGARVLVHGAGGGVGTFAVQIAKALGAQVTAVTSSDKLEALRDIGADTVVAYDREDFARSGDRHDVVIDIGGNRSIRDLRRTLADDGRLVLVGASTGHVRPLSRMIGAMVRTRLFKQRGMFFIANINRADLLTLKQLAETGALRPVVDSTHPLSDTARAMQRLETTHALGKVVITI